MKNDNHRTLRIRPPSVSEWQLCRQHTAVVPREILLAERLKLALTLRVVALVFREKLGDGGRNALLPSSSSPSIDCLLLFEREVAGEARGAPKLKLTNSKSSCPRRPRGLDLGILWLLLRALVGDEDDVILERDVFVSTDGDTGDRDRIEGLLSSDGCSDNDSGCPKASCGVNVVRDVECASKLGSLGEQLRLLLSKSAGSLVLRRRPPLVGGASNDDDEVGSGVRG
jgi:hypothetical protein